MRFNSFESPNFRSFFEESEFFESFGELTASEKHDEALPATDALARTPRNARTSNRTPPKPQSTQEVVAGPTVLSEFKLLVDSAPPRIFSLGCCWGPLPRVYIAPRG